VADGDIDVAVDRMRHYRMQDDIDAHRRELARRLRKPDVVAIEDAELADAFDIEGEELIPGLDALLQRQEWEHLAVASDNLAFGIDDRSRIVDAAFAALIHGTVYEPDAMMASHLAERIFGCARQRLGMLQERPITGEFREHHHLHPGEQMHCQIDALAHGLDIGAVAQLHLDSGNGKWRHDR